MSEKLIRIEHKETFKGIYAGLDWSMRDLSDRIHDAFARSFRHPTPKKDSLLVQNFCNIGIDLSCCDLPQRFIFGFCSKEQLRSWFYTDEILYLMHDYGFIIVEITTEQIIRGNTQACVNINVIEDRQYFDLLEYFGLKSIERKYINSKDFDAIIECFRHHNLKQMMIYIVMLQIMKSS